MVLNPKTKKPLKIPARNVPVFKAGKNLKEAVKKANNSSYLQNGQEAFWLSAFCI
jgi:hypothetical protein